jgi:MATE family multidrug resistance protein
VGGRHRAGESEDVRRLGRTIWAVSLPLLLVYVSETVIHVTDTAFLGRVGATELAALALVYTFFETAVVPVVGIAEAMQIVVARRIGQGRLWLAGATLRHSLLILLALSAALAVALHAGAGYFARLLAGEGAVGAAVAAFLRIAAYGVVPNALNLGFTAFYVGVARTDVLGVATTLLTGTNLVVSYGLVLGGFGLPRLGMEGAAWAFVVSETTAALFLTGFTAAKGWGRRRDDPAGNHDHGSAVRPVLRLAPALAVAGWLEALRWLAFFVVIGRVSETALTWANVVYACFAVFLIPAYAVGHSAGSLVSNVIGQGREGAAMAVTWRATRTAYVLTAPLATLALLAPHQVIAVFTDDPGIVAGAAAGLRVVAVALLLVVPAEVWLAAVAGTGATGVAFGIEVAVTTALLSCTAAVILAGLPVASVWGAMGVAALVGFLLSRWWLTSERVRHLD